MIEAALFWAACLLAVAGAAVCVVARNLLHAAFALGASLLGVAVLYLFLQAELLAAVQVLVYIGGILVLTVFAVMFSRDIEGRVQLPPRWGWWLGVPTALLTLYAMARLALATVAAGACPAVRSDPATLGQSINRPGGGNLGDLLLGPHLVPFLLVAVLLTVVLVAAVALVRKERKEAGAP